MGRRTRAAALALALAACAHPFGLGEPDEAERHDYLNAIDVAHRSSSAGRAALEHFLERHPNGPLADDAQLALARLERNAGRPAEAERHLRDLIEQHPRADRADSARLELASLLAADGRRDEAWEQATHAHVESLGDAERRGGERLLADLARERGDRAAEVEWLARLRASTDDAGARAAIDRDLDAALAALSTAQLLETAEGLGRRVPSGRAWLLAAERSIAAGDRATAWRALERAAGLPLEPDDAQRLARLQADAAERAAPPPAPPEATPPALGELGAGQGPELATGASGTIGLVLPLSGTFAPVAEQTLRGVLLAAGVFGSAPAAPAEGAPAQGGGVRVLVRDTAGRADRAAAAVRELAARGDVAAVIGPLLSEEVQAAAGAAREGDTPLLALTRRESPNHEGGPVFRVGLSRRMEAEVLAEHAVRGRGFERFAILHPEDEYGREFEGLLWQALEARGAQVVAVAGYDPATSDFVAPIRRLVGYDLLTDNERALLAQRGTQLGPRPAQPPAPPSRAALAPAASASSSAAPLPPIVDFQALFVPDAPDKIALIAPQLALAEVDGVTLFGPSAWHHPDLVRAVGPRLEGAFFTSAFDPENPAPFVREFVRRYQAAYGDAPSAFAAQGFDAANLVALQLVRGAATPADVGKGLLGTALYPGVSGATSFESDGNARKRPFLIEVRGGALHSLE
jgi:ABC-type branched-subunit amino acid transport system substrate-binding protein